MGDDDIRQLGHAALFGLEEEKVFECVSGDDDCRDAVRFKKDCGVDTPRCARSSVAGADQYEVAVLDEAI